jgi:DNA-binding GntR family transcriptional regulator
MASRKGTPAIDAAHAVAALEEDIVLGRLHPRQRITEDELLARFGLKRHVVREVLATLERIGLVERRKHVGALVRAFTAREVEELYAMRTLLECEAARRMALPPPAAALERLAAIQRDHDKAVSRRDLYEVYRSNLAFHRAFFALTGDEVLERAIAEYARQSHAIRFTALVAADTRKQARDEHRMMIDALARKDRAQLVALCRRHLAPSRDAYLEQLGPGIPA